MGSGGGLWDSGDTISKARMNQKTTYVGSGAPGTTFAGQMWVDTDDNKLYQRNAADNAWLDVYNSANPTLITTVGTIGTGVWQGTAIADGYIASAATWDAKQAALTFGISNTNSVVMAATAVDNDYAKFTSSGLEGRTYAEVISDLGLAALYPSKTTYDAHDHSLGDPTQVDYTDLTSIPSTFNAAAHALSSAYHTGDLSYTQLDSIVDTSGGGASTLISRADHVHTAADGSSKVTYANLASIPSTFAPASHSNTAHSTNYAAEAITLTAGVGLSGGGTLAANRTFTVDLSELTDMTADVIGTDELILLDAGADRRKAINEIKLSAFNNDQGWTSNTGDITGVTAGAGMTGGGGSGSVTLNVIGGAGITVAADLVSTDDSQIVHDNLSGFVGNEHINHANITFTAGVGLSGGGTLAANRTFTVDLSELTDMTAAVDGSVDEMILLDNGADRRKRIAEINLGQFNNDQGWTSNVGDITGVTAGAGMTGGGSSGSVTLNVIAGTLIDVAADSVSVDLSELGTSVTNGDGDFFVVVRSDNAQYKLTKANINLSEFNNNSGWTSNTGDITNVSAGVGLSGGGGSGSVTLTLDMSELTDMTAGVSGANDELILLDSGADRRKRIGEINLGEFNNNLGWTSNTGDITGVTAGAGMTGGGGSGSVTLNVIGGTGITVAADLVSVNQGEIDHGNLTGLSTGADHSYINQSVTSTASPSFNTVTLSGSLEITEIPGSDHTASGIIINDQVDVNSVGIGAAMHVDTDGNWINADASGATTMPCMGIAIESGTGAKHLLMHGFMRDDTWNWTVGAPIFVSATTGTFTQTQPAVSGDYVQVVGIAMSADVIYFNPDGAWVEVV